MNAQASVHFDSCKTGDVSDPFERKFSNILQELQLQKYYPQKLTIMDVIKIQDIQHHDRLTGLPWVFLHNLMMNNYKARDVLIAQHLEKYEESEIAQENDWNIDVNADLWNEEHQQEHLNINPLDLLLVLYECCSLELRQVLTNKLFLCRQAIPFAHPPKPHTIPAVGIWSILPIIIEHKLEYGSQQHSALHCPCHVVSFVRIGNLSASISKSKILNQLLSDQYHDTCFNRDCPLGSNERLISEGMVEAAWQLSSKAPENVTLYLNLRGDGLNWNQNLRFLSQISSVIVVMLDIKHLNQAASRSLLLSLHECFNPEIVLCIDASHHKKDQEVKIVCQNYLKDLGLYSKTTAICKLALNGRTASFSDIKKDLARRISDATSKSHAISLKDRLQNKNNAMFTTDEDLPKLKRAQKEALGVLELIPSDCNNVKTKVVPLQGKPWREFSDKLKASKQLSRAQTLSTIEAKKIEMKRYRRNQVNVLSTQDGMMKLFTNYLLDVNQSDENKILFITFLKLYLDERSRSTLPKFLSLYKKAWQECKAEKDKGVTNIQTLQTKLQTAERNLADASFGFEHLLRECGQIYEAIMECKDITSSSQKSMATSLSKACAMLLLLGQPFEVMDGDASNVPIQWVKAVLTELKQLVGDKKLLSLSVLGIQSSGKSTLLNTMFGLQFAVSAGRCTRGVFIQLIPVDKKETKFDYILVIDTEGLRASELAHEKHDHDNKLATFVIGLGDITIINIKGENTAEMKDVLQIVVHAFLRLKLANATLNLRQSCVFVHQNVSAADANDKMTHGRQKLVEKLDEMTKEAAQQELITNIQSFNQVIEFDSENDVWYFSDLWVGDPPMAPTNPGYCVNANEVRNAVLSKLAKSRDTFLTITDTMLRIEDLWNGIMTDDFVFAFRNSLEVKAYTGMERKFQNVRFDMSTFFAEFLLRTAKVQIANCNREDDLQKKVNEISLQLRQEASKEVLNFQHQMEIFVDDSELKDVMIQWIDTKTIKLKTMADSLLASTERDISRIGEEKKVQLLQATAKVRHENHINERARCLANELKGTKANVKQMKKMFEDMWDDLFREFSSTIETTDDGHSIEVQIEAHVWDQFHEIANFLSTQKRKTVNLSIANLEGTLSLNDFHENTHFEIHKNILEKAGGFLSEKVLLKKPDNIIYKQQVAEITNVILRRIDTKLGEITSQDIQFNINSVNNILKIIVSICEEHNSIYATTKKFNLLPPYKAFLVLHVLPYMTKAFTRQNEEYNARHSLKTHLEKYKATAWELFQNLVSHATEEIIAAGFFQKAIEEKVVDHVSEMIHLDIQRIMRLGISNNKYGIMKCVMEYLANTDNFAECAQYLLDPSNFVERWLHVQMNDMVFSKSRLEKSKYALLAENHITAIFMAIESSILLATKACVKERKDCSKVWIKEFTNRMYMSKTLPVTQRRIKDINNFKDVTWSQLKDTKRRVVKRFCAVNSENVMWKKHPIPEMMDDVWGCNAKCPFCYEPCRHTAKDHLDNEQKHECIQHRIIALIGTHWYKSDKFALLFCNLNVQGDLQYVSTTETGEIYRNYKDYRQYFPDWYIEPNSDKSKFWMWLLCKHKTEMERRYNNVFEDIPGSWTAITKHDAIQSLK